MACHLSALAGYVFPLGHLIGPLLVWLMKREQFPLVEDQGRVSLNFQISVTLYAIAAGLLSLVVIGIPLLIAVLVFQCVLVIIAAVRANEGERYRYPLTLRFVV
jgi:uncharacterized Tic20 family protein